MLPLLFLSVVGAFAQATVVSGKVTDESNAGLPGVTVLVKGTSVGTTTDIDGNFSLSVPDPAGTLVISYVGYKNQEVPINSRSTINVTMAADNKVLDEVVVIGYGAVKRRDLTGSVATVKSEEITKTPTHSAVEAIQGRAPGIDIVRSSGSAGANPTVRIRGNRSLTGSNDPLYIIDGFQGGNVNDLNPNDIESIEILKDASATAIYGSQGANGVIIITTKRGKEGKPKISYNGYYGVNGLTPFPERRLGDDYLKLRREAYRAAGRWSSPADDAVAFEAQELAAIEAGQWVDWVDLLMRNGKQQSHTVSVRGGSENTKAFFSAGYFQEEGMYRLNDMKRYNVRLNLDQKVTDWIKVGLLSQVTYNDRNGRRDPLSAGISAVPLGTPYNENGDIVFRPIANSTTVSPLADEIPNAMRDNTAQTNVNLNAYLELTPVKGLTFRSNFGSRLNNSRRGEYYDAESFTRRNEGTSFAQVNTAFSKFYHWDNILTYTKEIADHSFTVTALTNYTQSDNDSYFANGINQQLASQAFYNLAGTDLGSRNIGSGFTRVNTMSYAGRLNYSYKSRYLLTLTNRYDGSSVLSGQKFKAFPSVAAGWNISEESFMPTISGVNLIKLRGSYGLTGNSGVGAYETQSLLYPISNLSFGNDVAAPMYRFAGRVGNVDLGWEYSRTLNVGLDLGLFNNRVNANIDLYRTNTSDILYARQLPQSTGQVSVLENIAATRNKGVEVSVNTVNIDNSAFKWNSTITFTRNREEITDLVNGIDVINNETNSLLLGRPINSFFTYKKLGIWQSDEADEAAKYHFGNATGPAFQPGDIKAEDTNGDFVINSDDRQFIGSSVPKWIGGFRNSFSYKGFDLDIFLFARWGQTINAEFLGRYDPQGVNGSLAMIDYWTPENPTNDYPRPALTNLSSLKAYQALTFVNGSYFKIRNLSLGYNLPKSLSEKISVGNIRLYATGSNLLVVTKNDLLDNYDPEGGGSESYPINRQLVFGVNFDF